MEVAVAPLEFCAVINCLPPQTYQDSAFLHDGCPSCDTINSVSRRSTNAASSWRPQLSMNALGHKATGGEVRQPACQLNLQGLDRL